MPKLVDVSIGAALDVRTMRGATFDLTATVAPGTQNYTGANLKASARYGFHGDLLFSITESASSEGTVTGSTGGRIRILVPWSTTTNWVPRTYRYVVSLEVSNDTWEPVLQGLLVVTHNPEL
jgi:hypothetical protein